jgi:hypothetical protein
VIFSRGRGSGGRHHKAEERRSGRHSATSPPDPDEVELSGEEPDGTDEVETGPYDLSEAPEDLELLDLGSLKVPVVEGVEIRVQAGSDGAIQQVVLVHGDSALQLAVFAAPRSEGIWDEARADIRSSLFNDGVAVEEEAGEFGPELRARVRSPEGLNDLRFIGIDGPRWMLRAIYQGPAAVDPPTAAGPLAECLRNVVVDRGKEAMPALEALPLRLPKEVAEQAQEAAEQAQGTAAESPGAAAGPAPANGATPRAAPAAPRRKPSPRPRRSR